MLAIIAALWNMKGTAALSCAVERSSRRFRFQPPLWPDCKRDTHFDRGGRRGWRIDPLLRRSYSRFCQNGVAAQYFCTLDRSAGSKGQFEPHNPFDSALLQFSWIFRLDSREQGSFAFGFLLYDAQNFHAGCISGTA